MTIADQIRVVSCNCEPDVVGSPGLQFAGGGFVREPGKLDAGLLGYYPLGEYHGTDISGRNNHATATLDEPVDLCKGILCEQAEVFDGRQSFALPFELLGSITVSLWIQPRYERREATILSVGPDIRFGISFLLEPIITINYERDDETHVTGEQLLVSDRWYHLAMAYDAGAGYAWICVNGELVSMLREGVVTQSPRVPIVPAADRGAPRISQYNRRGDDQTLQSSGLLGCAQDVVIRSAALTPEEIAVEYSSYCSQMLEVAN